MTYVREVNLIVHPGWAQLARSVDHPIRQKLTRSWDQKIEEIQADRSSILVYSSMLDKFSLYNGLTARGNLTERYQDDISRIKKYSLQLQDRFILFSGFEESYRVWNTPGVLKRRGLETDFKTKVFAWGEYTELCVENWGEDLTRVLGLSDDNLQILEHLSFLVDQNSQVLKDIISEQAF